MRARRAWALIGATDSDLTSWLTNQTPTRGSAHEHACRLVRRSGQCWAAAVLGWLEVDRSTPAGTCRNASTAALRGFSYGHDGTFEAETHDTQCRPRDHRDLHPARGWLHHCTR